MGRSGPVRTATAAPPVPVGVVPSAGYFTPGESDMAEFQPTCELHLRIAGRPNDLTLRLHGDVPSEDDVAAWMQEGAVVRLQVTETAIQQPHTMMVNFGMVVFAWLLPCESS